MANLEENIMNIGPYNIKPIAIYLPDTPEWVKRDEEGKKYFESQGIGDIHWVAGVYAKGFGIIGNHIYLLDGRPEEQFMIGQGNMGNFLTWYMLYNIMNAMDYTHFLCLESDARFHFGWRERLEQALKDVPEDFDVLNIGACCAADKEPVHIKGDVYEFPYRGEEKWTYYPMCGHAIIFSKRCMPHLIATNRDAGNPVDISLIRFSFPKLRVFATLPRLAHQGQTYLHE